MLKGIVASLTSLTHTHEEEGDVVVHVDRYTHGVGEEREVNGFYAPVTSIIRAGECPRPLRRMAEGTTR